MLLSPTTVFLSLIVAGVVLTLAGFGAVQYVNYDRPSVVWNRLNLMAGLTAFLILNSTVGRTAGQCAFLDHRAGSFYNLTNGLARLFFQLRSNHVAPDTPADTRTGRRMAGAWPAPSSPLSSAASWPTT